MTIRSLTAVVLFAVVFAGSLASRESDGTDRPQGRPGMTREPADRDSVVPSESVTSTEREIQQVLPGETIAFITADGGGKNCRIGSGDGSADACENLARFNGTDFDPEENRVTASKNTIAIPLLRPHYATAWVYNDFPYRAPKTTWSMLKFQ